MKFIRLFSLLFLTTSLSSNALAADQDISTATTSGVSASGSDNVTITSSGSVTITKSGAETGNAEAVTLVNGDFTNDGAIIVNSSTTDTTSVTRGVVSNATTGSPTYINNGSVNISRSGVAAKNGASFTQVSSSAFWLEGSSISLINEGPISVEGTGTYLRAIEIGASATITNNDEINVKPNEVYSTIAVGSVTSDRDASGNSEAGNSKITNKGTINVSGTALATGGTDSRVGAIYAGGTGNEITNEGSIIIDVPELDSEASIFGIATKGDSTVTNKGTIVANQNNSSAASVTFTGIKGVNPDSKDGIFNYYTNGYLGGRVLFGTGTGNQINIMDGGKDSEHVITYEGTATASIAGSLLGVINSSAKKVAIFNRTEHARANEMSSDITNNVQNIIYNRAISSHSAQDCNSKSVKKGCKICACDPYSTSKDNNSWVKVIGNYNEQPAYSKKHLTSSKSYFGGVVAGYETYSEDLGSDIGFYAGVTHGKQDFKESDINIKSSNILFGAYTTNEIEEDLFLSFVIGAGYQYKDRERKVHNNLVAGGTEKMNSKSHSFFFAPSMNLSYIHKLDDNWSLIPSLSINYVNEKTGNFKEKKGNADSRQTVKSRFMGTLNSRLQLNIRRSLRRSEGYLDLYVGVDHRNLLHGKDVTIKAVGTQGEFDVSAMSQLTKAILGGRYSNTHQNGMRSFLSIELSKGLKKSDLKKNMGASINAGVSFNF